MRVDSEGPGAKILDWHSGCCCTIGLGKEKPAGLATETPRLPGPVPRTRVALPRGSCPQRARTAKCYIVVRSAWMHARIAALCRAPRGVGHGQRNKAGNCICMQGEATHVHGRHPRTSMSVQFVCMCMHATIWLPLPGELRHHAAGMQAAAVLLRGAHE